MTPAEGPTPPLPATGRLESLGPRVRVRAQPRLAIAVAAAGCALVVLGVLVLSLDSLAGEGSSAGSQLPGIVLSAAVVAFGLLLVSSNDEGPLASAGSLAAALGIPPLLFFITFDDGAFPPFSTEVILMVSTAAWIGLWAAGPARGRPFFLGAAAIGLWLSVLELVENVFTFPFLLIGDLSTAFSGDEFGGGGFSGLPDPSTIGVLSLLFGFGYLALARAGDARGFTGAATPLTFAALFILPSAIGSLSSELKAIGTGLLAIVVGLVVAAHGATVGRRATTWIGGAGAGAGVLTIVFDLLSEALAVGFALIAIGAAVIVGAEVLRRAIDEPDELTPRASTIGRLAAAGPGDPPDGPSPAAEF